MPLLKLKDIIDKMEEIEADDDFDGWGAWAELKDWFVKQKPREADGLANWNDETTKIKDAPPSCLPPQHGRGNCRML